MKILVERYLNGADFTLGRLSIDGKFECYTLEDERREVKVMHETRIPEGVYDIKLRTFGGHHTKYSVKFPDIHKGMLWLQDVPKFKDILIHIGNTDEDTSGCILVGLMRDDLKGTVSLSTSAYLQIYPKITKSIEAGEQVTIEIK